MTLIATVTAVAADYPIVLIASLCLVSPFLFTAAMAYFTTHFPLWKDRFYWQLYGGLLAGVFGCVLMLLDRR